MKRRRSSIVLRVASGVASAGVLAGASFVAATPASAATATDCTLGITVDSATGSADDIQTLLSAGAPLICLTGTFTLTTTLQADDEVTLLGLGGRATLDADGGTTILAMNGGNPLTIANLRFTGSAEGAVYSTGALTVTDAIFEDNNSPGLGGAIFADGTVAVASSVFRGNSADLGGAIFGYGSVTIQSSTFDDNSAYLGGAVLGYGTAVTVQSSTFDDNSTTVGGAAVNGSGVTVRNSTFVGNTGGSGALSMNSGTVVSSTFLDNSSSIDSSDAPALVGNIFASSGVQVQQVVWNEDEPSADGGGNLFTATADIEESAAVSPASSTRFGIAPASLFTTGLLADNGGPTPTLALSPTGPAIDAVPANAPSTDQRGVSRSALADAGAFEYVAPVTPAAPGPVTPVTPTTGPVAPITPTTDPVAPIIPAATVVAPVTPTGAAPVTPAAASAGLASTGVDLGGLLAAMTAMLAAGGVLLGASRRQRRRTTSRS